MDYEELTAVPIVFSACISTQTVTLTALTDAIMDENETLSVIITATAADITVPQAIVTIMGIYVLCLCVFHSLYKDGTNMPMWCVHKKPTKLLNSQVVSHYRHQNFEL